MKTWKMAVGAGLAMAASAAAQPQTYIMGINSSTGGGVQLFNAQDGTLVDPAFISGAGPAYSFGTPKGIIQVGSEIWVADQIRDRIFRFDLNGNYYKSISGNMNNIRGLWQHDGHVYVTNATAAGSSPGTSLVKFDLAGNYVSSFVVGSSPFDVISFGDELLVTHSSGTLDITRWATDGTSLGTFHSGAITFVQQITRLANGNFLAAGFSPPTGVYEYDASGNQLTVYTASGPRGVIELGNGNFMWSNGDGNHVYDRQTSASTLMSPGSGQYFGKVTIDSTASGACCFGDGTCQVLSIGDCGMQQGVFRGDGTTCATAACPERAVCCFADGTCQILTQDLCEAGGGASWQAGQTSCASVTCPTFLATPAAGGGATTAGAGIFFDLAATNALTVPRIDYFPGAASGNATTVQVYTTAGTYVGNETNPGAWTLIGTLSSTSQGTAVSLPITLTTPIELGTGQTVGVYVVGTTGGIRYRTSTSPNPVSDINLSLESNVYRSALFGGTATTGRRFAGTVWYNLQTTGGCYANCDESTTAPILNVADFSCFLTKFAAGDAYANCDGSTTEPTLNVADFSCFLTKFATGCR